MRKSSFIFSGNAGVQQHVEPIVVPRETVKPVSETVQPVIIPEGEVTYLPLSFACDRLTWSKSSIKKVVYNKLIQDWMEYDQAFGNWVRSCVMIHADNDQRQAESRCSIPDRWRDEIGDKITIVSANYIPVRQGTTHDVVVGVYHVMN